MKIACNTGFTALLLALTLAGVHTAHADSLSVFSTGVNAQRAALTSGAIDSHYTLMTAPTGVKTGIGSAVATTANPAWIPNAAGYKWISPGASGTTDQPVGNYDYRTTFTITPNEVVSTAQLSGLWTSDNQATIFLNGNSTGLTTGNLSYSALQSFSITSGFVSGVNNLDFVVTNTEGPSGVIAQVSGTVASSVTPEPSSLILLGTGLAGALTQVRRRLKA